MYVLTQITHLCIGLITWNRFSKSISVVQYMCVGPWSTKCKQFSGLFWLSRLFVFFFLTHNKTYTSLYFFSSDTLGMIDFRRETRTGALARQFLHRAGLETRQVEEETPPSRYCWCGAVGDVITLLATAACDHLVTWDSMQTLSSCRLSCHAGLLKFLPTALHLYIFLIMRQKLFVFK